MKHGTSIVAALAALALVVSGSALAATVVGTPKNDVLRGTAKADTLFGKGGNDNLQGLGGNDVLVGGAGNDTLVGGPGADKLQCGPGRDTAIADPSDKIASDCEIVKGIPKPMVSVADATIAEGNAGSQQLKFSVTLAKASPLRVTVSYATADGSATAGTDYTATSGQIVFSPGETSKTIPVPVVGDTSYEADETFSISLSNPVNAKLGRAKATGTITNDDHPPAKAGHYHGPISSGGFVDFDVNADGTGLANLHIVFAANCQPNATLTDSVSNSGVVSIAADGTFSANGSGPGITVSFNGKFTNGDVPLASGTLQIHESLDYQGTHFECDTGDSLWAAAWQG